MWNLAAQTSGSPANLFTSVKTTPSHRRVCGSSPFRIACSHKSAACTVIAQRGFKAVDRASGYLPNVGPLSGEHLSPGVNHSKKE